MAHLRSRTLAAWATAATLAVTLGGCSGGPGSTGDTSSGDGSTGSNDDGNVPSVGARDGSTDDATTNGNGPMAGDEAGPDAPGPRDAAASDASGDAAGATASQEASTLGSDASPDESAWLDPMNAARAMVGDPPLTWNPIAAQVALNYANQCQYAHNPNRNADYAALGGGKGGLGENIAIGAPTLSIASSTKAWIGEKAYYDYATNTCNTMGKNIECGHYTQIVWKTTTSVGCAIVTCTKNWPFPPPPGNSWMYAVCDYAPPGNIVPQGSSTPARPY